jgi:hypothetical protein
MAAYAPGISITKTTGSIILSPITCCFAKLKVIITAFGVQSEEMADQGITRATIA